jgi:hypothetical protein
VVCYAKSALRSFDIGITLLNGAVAVGNEKENAPHLSTYTFPKVNLILPSIAILLANTMDIYTTLQGLLAGNGEGNPNIARILNDYGFTGFALYKTSIIAAVIGLVLFTNWAIEKRHSKPEDVYFARRISHFGLWLAAATYVPIVANNILTFYIKVHGIPI